MITSVDKSSEPDRMFIAYPGPVTFERGTDPFHGSKFPDEFKMFFEKIPLRHGWLVLDWVGNVIMFLPDGQYVIDQEKNLILFVPEGELVAKRSTNG